MELKDANCKKLTPNNKLKIILDGIERRVVCGFLNRGREHEIILDGIES